jgi:hypothetical protein
MPLAVLTRADGNGKRGHFKNARRVFPGVKGGGLVGADLQIERRVRVFGLQRDQRVDGVAGAVAARLASVHHAARLMGESQAAHGQPLRGGGERAAFVPGLAGGGDVQAAQAQLAHGGARQGHVGVVRRIERAAEQADAWRAGGPGGVFGHFNSLLVR